MRIKLQYAAYEGEFAGTPEPRYYFEIQADGNYETLAHSEIYESKEAALHAIGLILHDSETAEFVDATDPVTP